MSNRFADLRLIAAMAAGSFLITVACKDSPIEIDSVGGSGGSAGSAGSNAGSGSSGGSGGAAGSGDMGGSTSVGGSGNAGGSGGAGGSAGAGTGGTGDVPPDAGGPDPDGGSGDGGGLAATFQLLDFAGGSTATVAKAVETWDLREKFTFSVTGNHTASATVEVANSQAELTFAAADPDPLGTTNVLQFVKIPTAAGDGNNWGGWAHVIFDLGSALPEDLVLALPQWDNGTSTLVPGTKVIQLDVYYDDTVDPNFDWDTLLALENGGDVIWNADAAQGYKIDLHLVNYAAHANFGGAYDNSGFYIGYSAYVPQPNTWVTLTFTAPDDGRAVNFYDAFAGTAAAPSAVTGIGIKPAPGYEDRDSNPVYLRNLRIVDAP